MLSRVADAIYWMARYIERAENTARIVNVNANLLLDLPGKVRPGWQPIVDITGNRELFDEHYSTADERSVVKFMIADQYNPGSLINSLLFARENARTIRDIIPRDGWERLNTLYFSIRPNLTTEISRRRRPDFLDSIIGSLQLITGLLVGTMLRDSGFCFWRLGRNIERADMITRIVDVQSGGLIPEEADQLPPYENIQWMSVLKSLSAYQSYCRTVQGPVHRQAVIRFLLNEKQFPRAFLHCLDGARICLKTLPRSVEPLSAVENIISFLERSHPEKQTKPQLHKFLDKLQLGLGNVHERIYTTYFLPPSSSALGKQ